MSARVRTIGRALRLTRWLGPWASSAEGPDRTVVREVEVPSERGPYRAWVLRRDDRPPTASLLVVPGLHFLGPADPRLERFVRSLARAGFLVLTPFLPDFLRLVVGEGLLPDTSSALDALIAQPDHPRGVRPGVFSISFGSMPALRLCAARSADVHGLVVFGGFADFHRTLAFALAGEDDRKNDPLNAPVVMINLLPWLDVATDDDRALLARAWRTQCERTWGREDTKDASVYIASAEAIADGLPPALRPLFLIGCRARPGTEEVAREALRRSGSTLDWIDPRPYLGGISCPVTLVHGRDDDVIPHEESAALAAALAPHTSARRLLTGLYGHTNTASVRELVGEASAAAREVASLVGIVGAIARVSG